MALVGLLLTTSSWANSAKVIWNKNSHYFQRFDDEGISWPAAKYKCESLKGHLATPTSVNEQGFIAATLLDKKDFSLAGYHIGGTKVANKWQWITGETWRYTNWEAEHHEPNGSTDYLRLQSLDGFWDDDSDSPYIKGYLCEWSYKNILSSTAISDMNKNGAPEFAELFQDAKTSTHSVEINDSISHKLLSKLSFPASTEPSLGMVALKNIERSNSTPELGVLIHTDKGSVLHIKDVKHNLITVNSIPFLDNNYLPKTISVSPDSNHNGSDEITVLGINKNTGKIKIEMRDSKSKAILRTVAF